MRAFNFAMKDKGAKYKVVKIPYQKKSERVRYASIEEARRGMWEKAQIHNVDDIVNRLSNN